MNKFGTFSVEELFKELDTSEKGLTGAEAADRLLQHGPNTLAEAKGTPLIYKFLANFYHLMAILLWIAGILSFIGGMPQLGWAIFAVIIINAFFSFWQEFQAEKATDALRKMLPRKAKVIRDHALAEVDAGELIPGDVLVLAEGDSISADARLFEEYELRVDNSTLTGESEPVRRSSDALAEELAVIECPNLVFAGTAVAYGSAKAVVFATAMDTQFGKIASLTQSVPPELSPLQKQINRTVRAIAAIAVVLGAVLFGLGALFSSMSTKQSFIFAIGMIVANVPEGLLPTVTLALAMGVQKLAGKNALVKKLSSVESLGSTTVICTDKTGTLTQNEMTVRALWVDNRQLGAEGVGYSPREGGFVDSEGRPAAVPDIPGLGMLLDCAVYCNNSKLKPPSEGVEKWSILGDPTEAALLVAAAKGGVDLERHWKDSPRLREIPFDSKRKMMSVIHSDGDLDIVYIKGAPKEVLDQSSRIFKGGSEQTLSDRDRQAVMSANDEFAKQALRVIGLGFRHMDRKSPQTTESVESDITFIGLMAMMDPPRVEVEAAVGECAEAGIRVIMITGDYGLTAESIARKIGLIRGEEAHIITGADLEKTSDDELSALLRQPDVLFARVSPEHKMRVAQRLKDNGEVVAMTGDGVNDAPALKRADIGVAMGITGTDVAKEASDMIVTDDNFATIVNAVEEGRVVFDNIQKFVTYIFAHLTPEIVPFALSVFGLPLGITVMQILAIDLGTETLPALALGLEPAEPGIMKRQPRSQKEGILTPFVLFRAYIFLGLIEAAMVVGGFFWVLNSGGWTMAAGNIASPTHALHPLYLRASTMAFLGIVTTQIGNIFACRTNRASVFEVGFWKNRWALWGVVFEVVVASLLIYVPPLASFFGMAPVGVKEWLVALVFAPVLLAAEEGRKLVARKRGKVEV